MTENYKRSVWPHAQGPWASREGGACRKGNWKQMHGVFSLVDPQSAPHPPVLPLSQIWAYTETDSMPGLPLNSLNSIEGPLSAPGVMGCFRSLGKPVEARNRFISPLQGVQWGRGALG